MNDSRFDDAIDASGGELVVRRSDFFEMSVVLCDSGVDCALVNCVRDPLSD